MGPESSSYFLHNKPVVQQIRAELWGQEIEFIQKACRPRRWWIRVPNQVSFILKRGDGTALVLEGLLRGCVKCVNFFLQRFTGGSGQGVSWELNKVIFSLMLITWENGFPKYYYNLSL